MKKADDEDEDEARGTRRLAQRQGSREKSNPKDRVIGARDEL